MVESKKQEGKEGDLHVSNSMSKEDMDRNGKKMNVFKLLRRKNANGASGWFLRRKWGCWVAL